MKSDPNIYFYPFLIYIKTPMNVIIQNINGLLYFITLDKHTNYYAMLNVKTHIT